jgi:fatty-acyl-CoA synthase
MRNQGIGSWPRRRARMTPNRVALTCAGRDTTYAELNERVDRLADALRGLGVRRGDRVAYLGANHSSFVETLFATGLLGAVFVPLNIRLAAPELQYILDDSGAELLICGRSHRHMAEQLRVRRTVIDDEGGEYEKLVASGRPEPIDEEVGLGDLCLIMYTSGTTGHPKGAMLSHGNLTWNTYNLMIDVDLSSSEVTLISAPLFHIAALAQTLLPTVIKGGRSILEGSFDVDRTYDLIESERVTIMFGVPAMFNFFAQSPRWDTADLSSLRNLLCGGAPVPEPLIRRYQERGLTFLQGYGMTETSPGALFLSAADSVRKAGTAGVPSSFTAMSPEWNQPSRSASAVASGRCQ